MIWAWQLDAFFWLVFPIAVLEGVRIARAEQKRSRRALPSSLAFGAMETTIIAVAAATSSPLLLAILALSRAGTVCMREREWWIRGLTKGVVLALGPVILLVAGRVSSFEDVATAELDPLWRTVILVVLSCACIIGILPVRLCDEPKETLVAPLVFIVFSRVALPLGAADPRFSLVIPIVAALLGFVCALWLLSAGMRANHFEPSTLVSELLVCERGVLLSFVWLGLAAGEHLAGVGALMAWWSSALALLALEASLRRRPLPKPMAYFALAMVVSLPGTIGFVAEDLLAHGLLEFRPLLAAAFVGVNAINAAALYLALANIIVDLGVRDARESRPSVMMLVAGGLSLLIGLIPRPFVTNANEAHAAIAPIGELIASDLGKEPVRVDTVKRGRLALLPTFDPTLARRGP